MGGACSSDKATSPSGTSDETVTSSVSSDERTVGIAEAAAPPNGTSPPRKAPRPVFTGEAAAVEKAFRDNLDAFARKDVDAVVARMGDNLGSRTDLIKFMDAYRIVLYRINNIVVTGKTATIDYENAIVGRNLNTDVTTLLAQHDVWLKATTGWMFQSDISSQPGIPVDLASVAVTLRDDGQIVIPTPLPKGEFAFAMKNTGSNTKGVFILGIPADLDVPSFIEQQVKSSEPGFPDNILEMGATTDIAAGGTGAMVFNAALPEGRYLLLTQITKSFGDTTLLPKEYAEFTVQ